MAARVGAASAAVFAATMPGQLCAETWNQTAAGTAYLWTDADSWDPTTVPNAIGATASFNNAILGAQTISLNGAKTVGILNLGATSFATTLAAGTGGPLTFDNTTSPAQLNVAGSAANVISTTVALTDPLAIDHAGTGSLTMSGVISGAGTFTKAGAGNLILSAANTYTGATTINAGTLTLGAAAPSGAAGTLGNATSVVNLGNTSGALDASLLTSGAFTIARNITVRSGNTGTITIGGSGANASVYSGNIVLNKSANLTAIASGTSTFSGVVSGAGGITKTGAGTVVLSNAANTYSGATTITAGVLQANSNGALSSGAVTIPSGSTGRLAVNAGVTLPAANALTINSGVTGTVGFGVLTTAGTGRGTFNGDITIVGQPTNGGIFASVNNTVGNELVINGAINGGAGVGMSQRDGRVIYAGGGNITGGFSVTGTAIVGATNGIPTGLTPTIGQAGAGTLDLASEGFNQTLPAVNFGNSTAGNNSAGAISLGSRTLTLNGDLTSISTATATVTHAVSGTAGGSIDFGAANRNIVIPDTLAADDLVLSGVSLAGSGGVTKTGAGSLVARNVTVAGSLNFSAGLLATSSAAGPESGSLTSNGLIFANNTTLRMKVGTGGDVITGGSVTSGGVTTVNLTQLGGALPIGVYNLVNYTGTTPGLAAFTLTAMPGRAAGGLIDTGTAIALNVTGNDSVTWTGANGNVWDINTTQNWKLTSSATPTGFVNGDEIIFDDSGTNTTISGAATVSPSKMTFANTTATPYVISSGTTIAGTGSLNKTGNGTVILRNANTFTGAVAVSGGTLELDHNGGSLTASSGVNLGPSSTLRLSSANAAFTFSRNLSGTGKVVIDPNASGTAASQTVTLTGDNSAFTGALELAPSGTVATNGSFRTANATNQTNLGGANIVVKNGGQLWYTGNLSNNITISGTGFSEAGGGTPQAGTGFTYAGIGAIRLINGTTLSGNITLDGNAKLGPYNATTTAATTTISGNVGITNPTDLLVIGGSNKTTASATVVLTGTNTFKDFWVNGGNSAATGTGSDILQVGAGGTTGTLGNSAFNGTLFAQPLRQSGLVFTRSDGYTLSAGQNIGTGPTASADLGRTFVQVNTTGTGLTLNGATIDLSDGTNGGLFRVGVSANNAVVNFNVGSTLESGTLFLGEGANNSATANQAAGSTVNVTAQVRVGHFGTETSTYHMTGGTLTLTGASPTLTPSTAGAGGAGAVGDNNIEGAATAVTMGGGIYVGIDGTGVFNHSGGTVTTNWMVLDNRSNTAAGTNMPDGIDRYNLSGTAELRLRSTWGMIARNTTTAVSFGGGSVVVDNTGTGFGTGANLTVPLDIPINAVAATSTTLNTNGAGNAFELRRDVTGTGTLNLTGGGNINVGLAGFQEISTNLSSSGTAANIVKINAGTTLLSGSASGFTGNITVNAGRLNVPNDLGAGNITIATGAAMGGEPTAVTNLTLNNNSTLFFNPNTPGALTTNMLTVSGTNLLDLTTTPAGAGPYTVVNYTSLVGTPNFAAANAANYRSTPVITNTGTSITLDIPAGKPLTWTGSASGAWDINTTANFVDNTATPDKFFSADTVNFPEGGANPAVTLTGLLSPFAVTVNSDTTNYTFTATAGNQIVGGTGLTKTGSSTLTLTGDNAYRGLTTVGGGTVAINGPGSIGDGTSQNKIAISGGGRLSMSAAMNLGTSRDIAIGSGGGSLSYNNAAGGTVTIPGSISSAAGNTLTFHSNAAGAGTFALTGDNSGSLGNLVVDAQSTGLTTLQIATNSAAPGGGSITLNYPAAGANGNANTLNLPGTTLPAGVTVNMTAFQNGTTSLRTQITSSGDAVVNGPITAAGTSVVQLSLPSGSLNINGNISDGSGGFTGTLFLRGAGGTGTINGTINLPTAAVSKTDAGTWVIASTGNTWASTALAVGTVRMGAANALPPGVALTLGQNDGNAASLVLNGFSQTVGSLASNPTTVGANTTGKTITSATAATFTVNQATNSTYASLLTGALSLTKSGSGTLTLAGANTYTGITSIFGGTLAVNGTHTGGDSYTIGNGATLGGSGSITLVSSASSQVLVQAGGTLAPGNSPGITNILNASPGVGAASTLSMAADSTLSVELNGVTAGTQYDRVNVTGTVNISGSKLAVAVGFAPQTTDEFLIIQNDEADAVTGSLFAAVNGTPLVNQGGGIWATAIADANGAFYTVNYQGGDGNDVVLTGIPEPASLGLAAMAGLGLLARRRRKA